MTEKYRKFRNITSNKLSKNWIFYHPADWEMWAAAMSSVHRLLVYVLWLSHMGNGAAAKSRSLQVRAAKKHNTTEQLSQDSEVSFPDYVYNRLLYFSKACGVSSCISGGRVQRDKSLYEGGCPATIEFCHNEEINPTVRYTRIALVLQAEKGELGTGYVMVDHDSEVITMTFRSSTTTQDWMSNLMALPIDYSPVCEKEYRRMIKEGEIKECVGCKMHRGFHRFTETLGRSFLRKIEGILEAYPEFQVVSVGHSLGAALAVIAGIELRLRGYQPLVLAYAPPRIFNNNMKDWVDDLFGTAAIHESIMEAGEVDLDHGYFRIVHKQDYVPSMPPFYHIAGLEIFINKGKLPHLASDLEYVGPNEDILTKYGMKRIFTRKRFEKLTHTYQHREYFIDLGGCSGF